MPGTVIQYNTIDLSVHHITPIEESYEERLTDSNLITVCPVHHKMCETGEIPRGQQRKFISSPASLDEDWNGDNCIVI